MYKTIEMNAHPPPRTNDEKNVILENRRKNYDDIDNTIKQNDKDKSIFGGRRRSTARPRPSRRSSKARKSCKSRKARNTRRR